MILGILMIITYEFVTKCFSLIDDLLYINIIKNGRIPTLNYIQLLLTMT